MGFPRNLGGSVVSTRKRPDREHPVAINPWPEQVSELSCLGANDELARVVPKARETEPEGRTAVFRAPS